MKKPITLLSVVLLSSIFLSTTQSAYAATYEDENKATSTGSVTILENDSPSESLPDPEDPDNPVIPDPENPTNPNPGLLRINYVSDFSFGSHENTSDALSINASLDTVFDSDGKPLKRVPFVSTEDRRGSNRKGWELRVSQLTPFKDGDGNELTGATLALSNLQYSSSSNAPSVTDGTITLNKEEQPLATASDSSGIGAWSLALGNAQEDETTDGVQLNIPRNTVKNNTAYTSTLLWELVADPTVANDGE